MNIKIKLFEGGKMPIKKTAGAAAYDCFAVERDELDEFGEIIEDWNNPMPTTMVKYYLGFALELPEGYCAKIIPRSSIIERPQRLANNIGLIDSDYRGEVTAVFDIMNIDRNDLYQIGDRVCQMLIEKVEPTTLVEVEELSDTERGSGGYGSTGK